MELNREQIIKALECCTSETQGCNHCHLFPSVMGCVATNMRNALSLIKELTEEKERLRNRITATIVLTEKDAEKIKAECLERIELDVRAIQADTVRKMQERLKKTFEERGFFSYYIILENIDQIAEEIIGETK